MTLTNVRKKLSGSSAGLIAAGVLIFAAIVIVVVYYVTHHTSIHPYVTFYSDDDGKSYFKDSIYKFPPWDHDGKPAYQAVVATDGHQTFVTCLERYPPDIRKKLQQALDANQDAPYKVIGMMAAPQFFYSMEWSLPGSGKWTPRSVSAPQAKLPAGVDPNMVLALQP